MLFRLKRVLLTCISRCVFIVECTSALMSTAGSSSTFCKSVIDLEKADCSSISTMTFPCLDVRCPLRLCSSLALTNLSFADWNKKKCHVMLPYKAAVCMSTSVLLKTLTLKMEVIYEAKVICSRSRASKNPQR